jgi:hypothetical protein
MMVDVINVSTNSKDAHPDRSSQITSRGPIRAKVLIRRRTGEIGRREKVGQHASPNVSAILAIGKPRRSDKARRGRRECKCLHQHPELHGDPPCSSNHLDVAQDEWQFGLSNETAIKSSEIFRNGAKIGRLER